MSELLQLILPFIGYFFIGGIVLYLDKAVDVILYKSSYYWKENDDDLGYVLFWPLVLVINIAILIAHGLKLFYRNIIGKFIITVTEVGIALFNLSKGNVKEPEPEEDKDEEYYPYKTFDDDDEDDDVYWKELNDTVDRMIDNAYNKKQAKMLKKIQKKIEKMEAKYNDD